MLQESTAEYTVPLHMQLKLAYDLLSVSKASEAGKMFHFSETG